MKFENENMIAMLFYSRKKIRLLNRYNYKNTQIKKPVYVNQ